MKKTLCILLSLLMIVFALPAMAESVETTVVDIQKYGNLVLAVPGTELLAAGYDYGDVITVTLNGSAYEMPIGSNYSDVDQGSMICRVMINKGAGDDYVILAINMGDLATAAGLAAKEKTEADPGYIWRLNDGVSDPIALSIEMKDKGGYYDSMLIHQLVRSENRADYENLTDEEYANFRMIQTAGIAAGRLYRSSSPVNPEINRADQADQAAKDAGIKTAINLADNEEVMRGYEGYDSRYYAGLNVIALNLGVDFMADDFKAGLADGFRFLAENEGPYLIHCKEGKDRSGFAAAILECLMGASLDEVAADYMATFWDFYLVQPGTAQYDAVLNSNILKSLATAFGVDSLDGLDLQNAAEQFLLAAGMTDAEIAALKAKLAE